MKIYTLCYEKFEYLGHVIRLRKLEVVSTHTTYSKKRNRRKQKENWTPFWFFTSTDGSLRILLALLINQINCSVKDHQKYSTARWPDENVQNTNPQGLLQSEIGITKAKPKLLGAYGSLIIRNRLNYLPNARTWKTKTNLILVKSSKSRSYKLLDPWTIARSNFLGSLNSYYVGT